MTVKTTLYMTTQGMRLTQFTLRRGTWKQLKDVTVPLPEAGEAVDIPAILQREGFARSALVGCLFRAQASVRFFSFPSHDEQEISRMVEYEAGELLPLKPEETIARFCVINRQPDGYAHTLVVVTPREEIQRLMGFFPASGAAVERVDLSSTALFHCWEQTVAKTDPTHAAQVQLLLYFDDGLMELLVIDRGILVFSRGVAIHQPQQCGPAVISEVRHSIELFGSQTGKQIESILVSSRRECVELVSTLQEHFSLPIQRTDQIDLAYGLISNRSRAINLLDDKLLQQRSRRQWRRKLILLGSLVMANIVMFGLILFVVISHKRAYLEELKSRLADIKPQARALQDKIERIRIVSVQHRSQLLVLDALTDLVRSMPQGCSLHMLTINEQGAVVIRGQATTLQDVLDFVVQVEKSPYFGRSNLNYSSRRKVKDQEIVDFEIQASVDQDAAGAS